MTLKKIIRAILPTTWIVRWRSLWLKGQSSNQVFSNFYRTNHWNGSESKSGRGSDLIQTAVVREKLPKLLSKYRIESMLDIPCGDFNWMQHVDLKVQYTGGDIVEKIIFDNGSKFSHDKKFEVLDITKDYLPKVDLIFCRDCLVHLSYDDVHLALTNIINSGSKYLLTTSFSNRGNNRDITTGQWRPINLEIDPFNFPSPIEIIIENCTEGGGRFSDKSLMLWAIDSISSKVFSKK
jgi:hypothetical protein